MIRKVTAVLSMLLLSATFTFAGEEKGKMDAAAYAAKLKAELNLTADQTTKVESIYSDFLKRLEPIEAKAHPIKEELKTLRSANPPNEAAIKAKEGELEAIRAEKKPIVEERDAALKQVLTPEQFAKFQEMAAAHKKQGSMPK